ncbi:MAG: transposase [bacterium]
MQRSEIFCVGEYYHIYSRGVDKRFIFRNNYDKARFQKCLYIFNGTEKIQYERVINTALSDVDKGNDLVEVGAYCLMDNHFHILVKEITEGGISKFMSKLLTSYSLYFNKISKRSGALFQGRFQSKYVDKDEYLKYLFAYIHLNPAKLVDKDWRTHERDAKKIFSFLEDYKFSSFKDYQGIKRAENLILTKENFPEYFNKKNSHEDFILNWLDNEPSI